MATRRQTSPWSGTPARSQRTVSAIARVAGVLRAGAWQFATLEGLNPTQVDILELLVSQQRGVRLSWIARQLGVSPASASDSIAALVAKGLVAKDRDPEDRRAIALHLSEEGRRLATRIAGSADFARQAVESLPEASQASLFGTLLQLIRKLQEVERFPELRTCLSCVHFRPRAHASPEAPHHCALVDAALSQALLRLDCPEHQETEQAQTARNWRLALTP